ncbi:cation transporter [Nitrosospira sp. NpAV]|uniref:cation transporter n=1 Tax=Nitrosospira sp. NpAV TaxID=58133 RepID=UPI000AC61E80|nr:cation transporter [Nitrosospira sp. NpAV]
MRYRRVLWVALILNVTMFLIEIVTGAHAESASLQADALDFLGDAGNYGISLFVAGMALRYRAKAAMAKGLTMGMVGLWVGGVTIWQALHGILPEAETMGIIGALALIANLLTFLILWAYRSGDANMRSVWLCSRNDMIGNVAVMLAALGVSGTETGWPDVVVAGGMAALGLQTAWKIVRLSHTELRRQASMRVILP